MNTFLPRLSLLFLFFVFGVNMKLSGQVLINEICPSNINLIQNSNGKYDDWIEIYNAGSSSVNLSGYGLTDNNSKPYLFTFPSYSLGAGKHIIVFASDSNTSKLVNHWEMAVNAQSSWKYAVGSASIDTNWRNLSFSDASWSSGTGGVGFGDGDDGTGISVTTSVFMRKSFNIPDTSQILKAVFMMDYDDGFVAYLNGVEIARANLGIPGTRPRWNDLAPSSHEAMMYQGGEPDSFFIDPVFLKTIIRNGTNVLSVQTHNNTASSSDMSSIPYLFFGMHNSVITFSTPPSWFQGPPADYFNAAFKLARTGETVYLRNSGGTIIDQKTYTSMDTDNSHGRKPDGSSVWCFFATPSPAATNNSATCYSGYASQPVFSVSAGSYSSARTLSLSTSTPGGVIRYTTNGNVPTSSSAIYSSAITISTTTTVRARVFASGYLPSLTVTNTYFINEDVELPVFTLTTDSLNLWDYNTGIYVMGPNAESASPYFGANFWQPWQKPATIEYFDAGMNRVMRFDAEIEIFGNYSRSKPQKSFEIKLSDRYGTSEIDYPIIPDKSFITKYDNIILRNSGTDWNVTHFRDALMERIMKTTHSGYLAAEPAVMFLNGEFWGVYTIHEKHDENWIRLNHGLSKSEYNYLRESGSSVRVENGSDASWWTMYNYATTQNPGTQAYYDYMNSVLDIKNYTDYFIAEIFYNNGDWIGEWTNNIKMWQPNAPGSKWRYLLYDTDYGLGLKGSVNDNRLSLARNPIEFSHSSEMFDAMLNNTTFKRYFINRFADLMNTIFLPSKIEDVMEEFENPMEHDMVAHFSKWGSNTSTWQTNINTLMNFANSRPNIQRSHIRSAFGLSSNVNLTLQVSPAGAGRIEISTITPTSYPWTGVYFNGNPVTITAIPNPGYTFDRWRSNVTITSNNYNQSVTYNFTANDVITCYFTGSSSPAKLTISELNYNSDGANNSGDWVEFHNYGTQALDISGWKFKDEEDHHIFTFPTGTSIAAGAYLVLVEDTAAFSANFPAVTNKIGPMEFNLANGGEMVRVYDHEDDLYLSFTYQDQSPWPTSADGGGYTLELLSPTGNLNSGTNWFAGCIGGSPGRAYSPLLATPVAVSGNTTFCSGGSVLLSATQNPGYAYQWRRNGSNLGGATSPDYTASVAGTYTVSVTYQGCSVISDPTVVTVVSQSPDPVTTSAWRCGAGQLTLYASSSDSIFWYDAPNGNLVGTGDSLVTPSISSTTTYYSRSSTLCPSNPVAATATILTPAATPVASDASRCGPGTVTLTASDTAVIRWYNALSGGALLETGPTFVTNVLNNDTVFYVEAGSVCSSPRLEVHVNINSTDPPVATDNFRCGSGTVVLSASASAPMTWYNAATGGSSLGSGGTFTTPSLSASDTFYVEANSGCASPRTRVIAIIEPVPPPPTGSGASDCQPGSFTLEAISSSMIRWFDASSGGNQLDSGSIYITPVLSTTTTFYAEAGYQCRSSRTAFQVVITAAPSAPSASPVSRCGPGSVTLSASSPEQIYWYDAASGGNLLHTGSSYTTPSLSTTTNYFVEAGSTNCRSTRISVQAVINSIPAPPVASDVSRCGNGAVTLTASAPQTIYWYSSSSGGSALASGSSYTTPSLSSTTTYYVETGDLCRSIRVAVQAIISGAPAAPTGSDVSRCGPGTVSLSASGTGTLSWFSGPSGGTSLATGTSFTTPSLLTTTTFYVEANNGCPSSSRTAIQAIIETIPSAPVAPSVSRCGPGLVSLSATGSGQQYWYSASTGGTLLFTGSSFTTPSISSTTTYYVETGGTCRSSRTAVQAVINPIPAAPSAADVSRCGPGTITLTATSPEQVYWYDQAAGGNQLGIGSSYTSPVLSSSTTYYAETGNTCRSARTAVQAIISSQPAPPSASDVSRCGTGTVTLSASGAGVISWFAASSGGSALASGNTFVTPLISTTTTYYAEANNGCTSASRTAVQAVINPIPSPPLASNASRCGTGTVVLNATSAEQIYWYSAASGGSLLGIGNSYTTPSISVTTSYYLETGNTCRSSRISVQAIVNAVPPAPSVTNASRCGTGTVTLSASSPEAIYWFDQSRGGNQVGTGNTYITPVISSTTTYYVETGNTCRSNRVSVQAIISAAPAAPVASSVSRCGPGTVNLSASASGTVNWFSAASGGSLLGTGNTFTTPSLSATTSYYAETNNGCVSATRTAVQAIINPVPAAPIAPDVSRCGAGSVTLSAVSTEQVYWYSAQSGGTLLNVGASYTTPTLTSTSVYYVETGNSCRSTRIPVQAIINAVPAAPSTINVTRCGPGTVTLSASSPENIYWYDQPAGGVQLGTGTSFTTPSISVTTTYYVECGNICRSTRIAVQAIIGSVPPAPTASDVSRCGTGTLVLSANSPEQVYWYTAPSGGTLLFTGSSYTTAALTSTTTFYAEAGNVCRSSSRTPVQAIIITAPAAPLTSDVSRCGPGSLTLSASSPEQIYWYDDPLAGNLLGTGTTLTTGFLNATTTYYVETGNSCRSLRIPVMAIIDPLPAGPQVSDVSRCGPGSLTLQAASPLSITWYSVPAGGTAIASGTSYTTPILSSTATYYVEAGSTCVSERVAVQAIIAVAPAAPVLTDGTRCGTGSVVLSGSASSRINWYDAASGGVLLDTGNIFNTPVISSTTTFYAEAGLGCNSVRVPVLASIIPLPAPPLTADTSRCGSGSLTLTASSPEQIYWYDVASGGTDIETGPSFTTPSLSSTTTYYVETGDQCRSLRVAVNAIILQRSDPPVASDVSRCGPGTVTLTASSPETMFWYENSSGGPVIATGAVYTTPVLTSDESYYISAGDVCESTRTRIEAIITSQPSEPVLTDGARCGPGSVELTGSSPEQINWYDAASGGTLLGTGSTFNTPAISVNTVFYADAGIGCNSNRVSVNAEIIPLPASPAVISDTACGSASLTLSASSSMPVYWYDMAVGGSLLSTDSIFITPLISTTTNYYVETGDLCRSIRRSVPAVIIPEGVFSIVENGYSCGPGSVLLTANSTDSVYWYDLPAGGTLLGSGSVFTTPQLTTTQIFYAVAGHRCPGVPVEVLASVLPAASVDLGPDTIFIQSGQNIILDPGSSYVSYVWSTGDSTSSIVVNSSGSYEVQVTDTNGCTASDMVYVNVYVGISSSENLTDLKLYPNPVSDRFYVSWSSVHNEKVMLEVFTSDGKKVYFGTSVNSASGHSAEIATATFSPGVYLLRISSEKTVSTLRFLVER